MIFERAPSSGRPAQNQSASQAALAPSFLLWDNWRRWDVLAVDTMSCVDTCVYRYKSMKSYYCRAQDHAVEDGTSVQGFPKLI